MDLGHQPFPQPIPVSRPIDTLLLWQQHTLSRNTPLHQPNRLDCGGARLSGNRSTARIGSFFSRCVSIPGGFKVLDASGQALVYVYALEARRIAANVAKMPELLGAKDEQ
jgi:hypothetical protein